ncbi:ubiquinol-cytochrome c reductase iron-sulfur subunit [Hymenobacter artigasi]|uniref:Cytochrome b6-f complex iron-sulfur subunit n=1 Tax=Hymenobacter artigasi TaxID=2719616 RepID=A0ABX1HB93_9BACT|nr:Rieske (2Fe-2S) protein [Hymenobacter artigasi]NKI87455.1 cytochrome b6-f complex iron-sulfur subunit [Hymenobacter artigasi]
MANSSEINRKDFLQLFGLGATALVASACLGGCGSSKSSDPVPGASGVDFTVDLTAASSAPLNDAAKGYLYSPTRDVIVAKTTAGTYVALQAPCTHDGTSVYFTQSQSRFVCPNHNAIFDVAGTVLSGPAPRALKQYTVTQTGTSLRIMG